MKHAYLFVFGRTPQLSQLELKSIFPRITTISTHVAAIDEPIDPVSAIERLGGTTKIARLVGEIPQPSVQYLAEFLSRRTVKRFNFGISAYDSQWAPDSTFLSAIKENLETRGISARFVLGACGELSTVVVKKQAVVELIVVPDKSKWLVGETVVVQDYEEWAKRDRARPFAEPKAGMLPPKIARMIVNIALRRPDLVGVPQGKPSTLTLLDPFCGMGTILGEALLSGCHIIGSDQSESAVAKAQANLNWLKSCCKSTDLTVNLFAADATHVSEKIPAGSVDAIVTEPFMGSPLLGEGKITERDNIANIIKGLEKLYIGCFRNWHSILKPGGKIVIALPKVIIKGQAFAVKKVIDTCENLGYTLLTGPIEYSRPQAIVRREFYVLNFLYGSR